MSDSTDHLRYATPAEMLQIKQSVSKSGVTHRVIAEALGLDVSAISKILSGSRKLKRAEFDKVQKILRTHISVGDRLLKLARIARADPHDIGSTAGLDAARIDDFLHDTGAPISEAEAHRLADTLGIPKDYFLWESVPTNTREVVRTGMREKGAFPPYVHSQGSSPSLDIAPERHRRAGGVTIFAPLRPLDGGIFADEFVEAEVRQVPMVENIAGAYGLWVGNDWLAPRYERGDILYVHPGRPVGIGHWALVRDGYGGVAIGKVEAARAGQIAIQIPHQAKPKAIDLGPNATVVAIIGSWVD